MTGARSWIWAAAVALLIALPLSTPAWAQPQIPDQLVRIAEPPNADGQQSLVNYAKHWLEQLAAAADRDDPEALSTARKKLIEPLYLGENTIFERAYSLAFITAVRQSKVLASPKPQVRLNVMIVTSEMVDPAVISLISEGLKDTQPAVRYWAAKAITSLSENTAFNAQQQQEILQALGPVLNIESSAVVLEQMMGALVVLQSVEAADRAIQVLDDRIRMHQAGAQMNVAADVAGLQKLLRNLVLIQTSDKQLPKALLERMVVLAFKYYQSAVTKLDNDSNAMGDQRMPVNTAKEYKNLVKTSDTALRWGSKQLAPESEAPEAIDRYLSMDDFVQLLLLGEDWRSALTQKAKLDANRLLLR